MFHSNENGIESDLKKNIFWKNWGNRILRTIKKEMNESKWRRKSTTFQCNSVIGNKFRKNISYTSCFQRNFVSTLVVMGKIWIWLE